MKKKQDRQRTRDGTLTDKTGSGRLSQGQARTTQSSGGAAAKRARDMRAPRSHGRRHHLKSCKLCSLGRPERRSALSLPAGGFKPYGSSKRGGSGGARTGPANQSPL